MAESRGVWGIEIGQAGLKAMRLRYAEAARQAIAVSFDYVPHPKILSQPDAIPEELVRQSLETFLGRNDISGDKIVIAVPGQSALARFIQLPPVESHRVAEIVKYEARQQIPFALEDVIWDYQNLGGGMEESGYVLEAEVGLFAMKREQVQAALKPFLDHKVEVDVIQIAPLGVYNMLCYDRMGIRVDEEFQAGTENTIVIDMGADNSTLVVSNGEKIWIRNVPIGGNHFTRALTKEMKLTFAKAEHLKCNATKSPDPRAVFQALRPVFNDYVSEIQRSIGYFSSVNRDASISKVLGVGNGFKLAGLQKFLQQNLQYDVERVDSFNGLVGDNVLSDPVFQENVLSFAVPYGLALQGLELTRIHTSLLPPEIATARKIRRKKPWALVTAATLLVGLATSVAVGARALASVESPDWEEAKTAAADAGKAVTADKSAYEAEKNRSAALDTRIGKLVEPHEVQFQWPELYKAVYDCLPQDEGDQQDNIENLALRNRIKITSIKAEPVADLATWWTAMTAAAIGASQADKVEANAPTGPGYVVQIEGLHYHDIEGDVTEQGTLYVQNTLLHNLQSWEARNIVDRTRSTPVRDIGISHAFILESLPEVPVRIRKSIDGGFPGGGSPYGGDSSGGLGPGYGSAPPGYGSSPRRRPGTFSGSGPLDPKAQAELEAEHYVSLKQTTFVIQFAWQPMTRSERAKFTSVRKLLLPEAVRRARSRERLAQGMTLDQIQAKNLELSAAERALLAAPLPDVTLEQAQEQVRKDLELSLTDAEFQTIKARFQRGIAPSTEADTTTTP